jgi:uncharacterized membrane protein YccC
MFNQIIDPAGDLFVTLLVALVPVVLLLALPAVFRMTAWLATLIGSIVTLAIGMWVWGMRARRRHSRLRQATSGASLHQGPLRKPQRARPRGRKNRLPALNEERLKDIVVAEPWWRIRPATGVRIRKL